MAASLLKHLLEFKNKHIVQITFKANRKYWFTG